METLTPFLSLTKPGDDDFYNIQKHNANADIIDHYASENHERNDSFERSIEGISAQLTDMGNGINAVDAKFAGIYYDSVVVNTGVSNVGAGLIVEIDVRVGLAPISKLAFMLHVALLTGDQHNRAIYFISCVHASPPSIVTLVAPDAAAGYKPGISISYDSVNQRIQIFKVTSPNQSGATYLMSWLSGIDNNANTKASFLEV